MPLLSDENKTHHLRKLATKYNIPKSLLEKHIKAAAMGKV